MHLPGLGTYVLTPLKSAGERPGEQPLRVLVEGDQPHQTHAGGRGAQRPHRDRRCPFRREAEGPGGDGREGDAGEAESVGNLQAAPVAGGEQLRLAVAAAAPSSPRPSTVTDRSVASFGTCCAQSRGLSMT